MRPTTVIQRVRQILTEGQSSLVQDAPDIAVAFSDLCKKANERLRICSDYLKQGMVSEALRIAETEPTLLDLCGELDFIGIERWLQLCGQRKWTVSEPIDAKAIHALNNAYASGQALEPFLKEYRRAVRERRNRDCVRLLRRIASLDKANTNWAEDLKEFERKQIHEIKREFEVAKDKGDAETLAALMMEINGAWSIPFDEVLKRDVLGAAREIYKKEALEKGRHCIADISAAYAALDYGRLGPAIAAYKALSKSGYLVPDTSMTTQMDEACEWYAGETKKRLNEKLYEDSLAKLREAVEKGIAEKLDEQLNLLARFDRPIPDRLEERAHALIDAHHLAQERRRKRWMVTAAVGIVLIASAVAFVFIRHSHKEIKAQLLNNLANAYKVEDVERFNMLLSRTERDQSWLMRDPDVRLWAQKSAHLAGLLAKKQSSFLQSLSRLESIRDGGFKQGLDGIEDLITVAKNNVTQGADRGRLAVILQEWESHKLANQAEIDRQAAASIDEITYSLEKIASLCVTNWASAKSELAELRFKAKAVENKIESASPEPKARMASQISRIDAICKEIECKERQLQVIREASTLRDYLNGVQTYVRAFPNDKSSNLMKDVLREQSDYLSFIEPSFNCNSSNPFWYSLSKDRAAITQLTTEKWPEVKTLLMGLNQETRLMELWECDTTKGKVFFEGKPKEVYLKGFREYEGSAYTPGESDIQPEFKSTTVDGNTIKSARIMSHCDFVKGVISMARFSTASTAPDDLMNKMQELYETNGISPLLKIRLMGILFDSLTTLIGQDQIPGGRSLTRDLKSIDSDLHWLCIRNRDVLIANKKAETIMRPYFDGGSLFRRNRFNNDVRNLCLQRSIRWLGYADLEDSSKVIWKTQSKPVEIWIVRSSGSNGLQVILAAERKGEVMTQYVPYICGEPLFAPADDIATRVHMTKLKTKYNLTETKTLKWPLVWPANFRQ
ncbi:MAG: hypothetical protein WCI20_00035 [bacterium]